jgi:predicted amidophosphoribosyltransferase
MEDGYCEHCGGEFYYNGDFPIYCPLCGEELEG